MNRLVIVIAAAAGALLFRRRKTMKQDADRVKNAARDGARKVNNRIRGDSDDDSSEDEPIVDLADDVGSDDDGSDAGDADDASSEDKAATSATD